uniref:F-box associated domain-containing protein n=1 Tax=Solanum tuberosum TaxID=4113 RepID=M1D8D5_SOLTU
FQSVSKLWNAIISDKEFRKIHIEQSKASSTTKFLLVQTNDGVFEFRDLENPKIVMRKQKFPLKGFQNPIAMGSCDSLVLMKTCMDDDEYVLWNSYTNVYRIFVCPYSKEMSPHGCGLCYDSDDDECKVILIYTSFYVMYYVKRNKWIKKTNDVSKRIEKVVNGVTLYPKSLECSVGISVIGGVFWSFSSLEILHQFINTYSTIIYFDVKTDELKEFPKPYFVSAYQLFRLTSLKGCVGLYGGLYGDITFGLDVWIMEQGGWTLLIKINICNNSYFCDRSISNIVLLGCTRNGEILFQIGRSLERLVMYDPKRREFLQTVCISEDSKHDSISEDSKYDIIPICSESFYFPIET